MADEDLITATMIRYLLVMEKRERTDQRLRGVDIAADLNLSRPSIHRMMKQLAARGLIDHERYKKIHLRDQGRQLAQRYCACVAALSNYLQERFVIPPEIAARAVYALLAELPLEDAEKLAKALDPQ